MPVKIALPKGCLLRRTAALLQKAGWRLDEYHSSMGFYRPRSEKFPDLLIRVFHEKDIPIQIAMGNYDLGICGLDWVEELLVKYPSSAIIKVRDLLYGDGSLYMAAASLPKDVRQNGAPLRIASEYPNLAEVFALKQRMSRFSIFQVWGAAEAYPPENADMALLAAGSAADINSCGIVPFSRVLDFSTFLIANRNSWENKKMDKIVASILEALPETPKSASEKKDVFPSSLSPRHQVPGNQKEIIRLALPDGHQQQQTVELLSRAGIKIIDYPSGSGNRRPDIGIDGVGVKVIRPQDMPLQVANGNFDLAITGRDWLTDHLAQFPSSPAKEILDLKLRRVRLVAVVSRDLPIDNPGDLLRFSASRDEPFRLASEYVNIADKYARENHLGHYRVIPTWGATEAFLPEDADLLIENTETGRTIARHNLKIIETLFESTACLIGNAGSLADVKKSRVIDSIVKRLRTAVGNK
ncbi:MAG: ATP phosphoribosyltransferase [Chloroflexi bacterium RBG_13_51_18]|nr:MAG: ATP phosphoribosyltransferase [Chloroflexi bacterium RBG_13_51_18]